MNGRIYKSGDVVESDADLSKLFVGKFERISGEPESNDDVRSETRTPFDTEDTRKSGPGPVEFEDDPEAHVFEEEPELGDKDEANKGRRTTATKATAKNKGR